MAEKLDNQRFNDQKDNKFGADKQNKNDLSKEHHVDLSKDNKFGQDKDSKLGLGQERNIQDQSQKRDNDFSKNADVKRDNFLKDSDKKDVHKEDDHKVNRQDRNVDRDRNFDRDYDRDNRRDRDFDRDRDYRRDRDYDRGYNDSYGSRYGPVSDPYRSYMDRPIGGGYNDYGVRGQEYNRRDYDRDFRRDRDYDRGYERDYRGARGFDRDREDRDVRRGNQDFGRGDSDLKNRGIGYRDDEKFDNLSKSNNLVDSDQKDSDVERNRNRVSDRDNDVDRDRRDFRDRDVDRRKCFDNDFDRERRDFRDRDFDNDRDRRRDFRDRDFERFRDDNRSRPFEGGFQSHSLPYYQQGIQHPAAIYGAGIGIQHQIPFASSLHVSQPIHHPSPPHYQLHDPNVSRPIGAPMPGVYAGHEFPGPIGHPAPHASPFHAPGLLYHGPSPLYAQHGYPPQGNQSYYGAGRPPGGREFRIGTAPERMDSDRQGNRGLNQNYRDDRDRRDWNDRNIRDRDNKDNREFRGENDFKQNKDDKENKNNKKQDANISSAFCSLCFSCGENSSRVG